MEIKLIFDKLEENIFYYENKKDILSNEELIFFEENIKKSFEELLELNKIEQYYDNKQIEELNSKINFLLKKEEQFTNKDDLNIENKLTKKSTQEEQDIKNFNFFNNISSKQYKIKFVGTKFNAKFDSDTIVLLSDNNRNLMSIPFDNIINYYGYTHGKFSSKIETFFLFLLFAGSLFYMTGFWKIIFVSLFGLLLLYPFIFGRNFIFIKLKMDTEPDNPQHYRPIIKTYKIHFNELSFLHELKKHVKFYHSVTRIFG